MSLSPELRPPLVFISYDHDEVELHVLVLDLANQLRCEGVDARLDLHEPAPAEGWELWRERQLLAANFVVVVCTASYRRWFEAHDGVEGGLQVRWEAALVRRRLHDDPAFGARLLPVLPHDAGLEAVPELLRGYTRYAVPSDYRELYRRLTDQPAFARSLLGMLRRRIDGLPRRSPVFEGREGELAAMRDALQRSSDGGYTVVTGMGGIGKTRLALEHAYCCEADYDLRWWVRASEPASLQADLVRLGVELGILTRPDQVEASTREVLAWLSSHQRWLVVYDDAHDPVSLHELLPSPCRGHVIVTSRAGAWRSIARVVELRKLSPQAARTVLMRYCGGPDDGFANEVAATMGHLPLALVQAGAYMDATGCSFREYLECFAQAGLALLDGDHKTITRTWELSLELIRAVTPTAAALLDWLAFLDPDGVPIPLLRVHLAPMPEPLQACVSSQRSLDDAIATLRAFGLIEREDGRLRVHRLIGAVTREKLGARREEWGTAAARWVCAAFSYELGRTLIHGVPLGIAEQLMAVSAIHTCAAAHGDSMARALINAGDFYLARGTSQAARTAYVRALVLREAHVTAEPEHVEARRDLALALNRLGIIESRAGELASARRCFSRAFELRRALADDTPLSTRSQDDIASSLSKLGDVELLDGDVKTAAELFAQAVERRGAILSESPDDTMALRALAHSSRKLGKALARLGDHEGAKRTLRCGLAIVEEVAQLEPHDPMARRDLWLVLDDLGDALRHDGERLASRVLHERALAIVEALAAEDPDNAQARRDLSIGLHRWGFAEQWAGHHTEARRCMERALALREALASADPRDAQTQHDLTVSLERLAELEVLAGNPGAALEHRQRAAGIRQTLLVGRTHHDELDDVTRSPTTRCRVPWSEPVPMREGVAFNDTQAMAHVYALEAFGRSALRAGNLRLAQWTFLYLITVTKDLARAHPQSFQARRRVASAYFDLGRTERKLGLSKRARNRLHHCLQLFGALAKSSPAHVQNQRDLAVCRSMLASLEVERGNLEHGRELLEWAHEGFVRLAAGAPRDASALRALGTSFAQLGAIEIRVGNLERARELYQRNLGVAQSIAELDPISADAQLELQRARRRLAELEDPRGEQPEARETVD